MDMINEARENIVSLLQQSESEIQAEDGLQDNVQDRQYYSDCIEASNILSVLSSDASISEAIQERHNSLASHADTLATDATLVDSGQNAFTAGIPVNYEQTSYSIPRVATNNGDNRKEFGISDGDRLNRNGFASVKIMLANCANRPLRFSSPQTTLPYVSMGDLGMKEGWSSIPTNVAYCYDNTPTEGWRREVAIRMSGKSKGNVDIHYVTPDKRRRFRSRPELHSYLSRTTNSSSFINNFDFRTVFCMCHTPEDSRRSYLECSFGLAGCNRWLHPECVGLGSRSEQELALMPRVVCPYCTSFLEGTGELEEFLSSDMM